MTERQTLFQARPREAVKRAKEHLASHYTPMTEPPCDAHALATDVLVLAREADGLLAECETWRKASETWRQIERAKVELSEQFDALADAARRISHGDHHYDIDVSRDDCTLCAAIELRYQPTWMDEPLAWLGAPTVKAQP